MMSIDTSFWRHRKVRKFKELLPFEKIMVTTGAYQVGFKGT
jgi:hypothetical protein